MSEIGYEVRNKDDKQTFLLMGAPLFRQFE